MAKHDDRHATKPCVGEARGARVGDWFQIIVDPDATLNDAPALAVCVRDWLIARDIVRDERTDCVLGSDYGWPPSPHWWRATVERVAGDERFLKLWTNGMAIRTTRSVFSSGRSGTTITCPRCGASTDYRDDQRHVFAALAGWFEGGVGLAACPRCSEETSVTDWLLEPAWGFGNLGFKFWNWPPLSEVFLAEISGLLGHRTVLVRGKL